MAYVTEQLAALADPTRPGCLRTSSKRPTCLSDWSAGWRLECVGVADPIAGTEVAHTRGERDATVRKEFKELQEFKEDKRSFFALPRAVTDHSRGL